MVVIWGGRGGSQAEQPLPCSSIQARVSGGGLAKEEVGKENVKTSTKENSFSVGMSQHLLDVRQWGGAQLMFS